MLFVSLVSTYYGSTTNTAQDNPTDQSPYEEAEQFIDRFQQNSNCSETLFARVNFGYGGGFASQYQAVVQKWLIAASYFDYQLPIIITGKIRGYTDDERCRKNSYEWTCVFEPISNCAIEDLTPSNELPISISWRTTPSVPQQFQKYGEGNTTTLGSICIMNE